MSETLLIIIDINFKQNDAHKNTVGDLIPLGHYFLHNLKQSTSPTPKKKRQKGSVHNFIKINVGVDTYE